MHHYILPCHYYERHYWWAPKQPSASIAAKLCRKLQYNVVQILSEGTRSESSHNEAPQGPIPARRLVQKARHKCRYVQANPALIQAVIVGTRTPRYPIMECANKTQCGCAASNSVQQPEIIDLTNADTAEASGQNAPQFIRMQAGCHDSAAPSTSSATVESAGIVSILISTSSMRLLDTCIYISACYSICRFGWSNL